MKKSVSTAALLTAMAATQVMAQVDRTPASAGREEFIEVEKNVRLHVTDQGNGKTIVLIHGWPLSDAMYEYQYQYLVEKGFRVVGITLRGFGKSDKPYGTYNFDVYADDIYTVLHKLNIKDATLGGFSMGGAIAIRYVTRYNSAHVSKLALFGAAAPRWTQTADFAIGITDAQAEALIAQSRTNRPQMIEDFGKIFAASETNISQGIANWLTTINMEASPYATTQSLYALRTTDLRPELSKINIPVAIFHGVKDKICDFALAEELNKGIRNSFIVRFENSGHGLFVEELEKFNTELEKFASK
ncbi:MAG: alpha/beta fold hydrolase [Chitinophagaceae bacterium]